jgi:hypothetical protein
VGDHQIVLNNRTLRIKEVMGVMEKRWWVWVVGGLGGRQFTFNVK